MTNHSTKKRKLEDSFFVGDNCSKAVAEIVYMEKLSPPVGATIIVETVASAPGDASTMNGPAFPVKPLGSNKEMTNLPPLWLADSVNVTGVASPLVRTTRSGANFSATCLGSKRVAEVLRIDSPVELTAVNSIWKVSAGTTTIER